MCVWSMSMVYLVRSSNLAFEKQTYYRYLLILPVTCEIVLLSYRKCNQKGLFSCKSKYVFRFVFFLIGSAKLKFVKWSV